MAIIPVPTKWTRIAVWILDIIVVALLSAQEVFEGFVIPSWYDGAMAALALVLSVVFGVIWDPNKNRQPE